MSKSTRQITTVIPKDKKDDIEALFNKTAKGKEFEFIFFSKQNEHMNKEKYILLLKYMRAISKQKNYKILGPISTLDVGFSPDITQTYRMSIQGIQEINKNINRVSDKPNSNQIVYKFLTQILKKDDNNSAYEMIIKRKDKESTVDLEDISTRVRLSAEDDIIKDVINDKFNPDVINKDFIDIVRGNKLTIDQIKDINNKIYFRLKERTSLYIEEDDNHFIRIDLSDTKTTNNIKKLNTTYSNYELEIEYGIIDPKKAKKDSLDKIYETAESLLKLIQQSNFIITNTMSGNVIEYYRELMGINESINNLVARQPVSLEIQHVTEIMPNRYAVTDKADGDRYFLIIYKGGVYLISNNLNVRDTGIMLDKKNEKYNGTVLDGEYIFLPKEQRHLYMIFDCLRVGSDDVRHLPKIMDRLAAADVLIEDCFIFKDQTGFKFKEVPAQKDEFNIDVVRKFYSGELYRHCDILNKDMKSSKMYPLIRRKFFMPVFGAKKWELYDYSVEYWKLYVSDSKIKMPYLLDGLVYHPLEQSYITNINESKYQEFKWKPSTKNSIDFYIEFKRDRITGNILDVYDNSNEEHVRNRTYRICTLYVGKVVKNREQPVPFEQNYNIPEAYLYMREGDTEVRDLNGDIISDRTVVEFYYQNDPSIIPQQRWVAIKTRYDKTESVERFGKKYGNYSGTAEKIWRSIINPVLMDDFIELAKGNTDKRNAYDIKIRDMMNNMNHSLIVAANKENRYYQKQSKLAHDMRQFHNFIKSNLIYTYCNKMYQSNTQQSVLDIACGRGGDILKFYYASIAYYVGIDLSEEDLKSTVDGAISRYNMQKKKKPNFPKMYYIHADGRALLDYESQSRALGGMDNINKSLLEKFFPSDTSKKALFDRVSCQMAIHYFLQDETSWKNFKTNINNHLRNGGYFIATCFDAKQVIKAIGDKDSFTVNYDDAEGNKKVFFDIIKRYEGIDVNSLIGVGHAIDVFFTWAFEDGTYLPEYLVDIDFIKAEFLKDCDMELVDTDLFGNQMEINRSFLTDALRYESAEETLGYLGKVTNYYNDDEINKKSIQYTQLHRYFVFRKRIGINKGIKGGSTKVYKEEYDFSDIKKFRIPNMENYNDSFSMINSIHKILEAHKVIPKIVKPDEFMKDIGLSVKTDVDVDNKYIKSISNKLIINHEVQNKVENILDGVNIFVVERDCNNFYDIEYCLKNKDKKGKALILMKEGGLYKPIMKKEPAGKGVKGIFKMSDDMIQHLLNNGSEIA